MANIIQPLAPSVWSKPNNPGKKIIQNIIPKAQRLKIALFHLAKGQQILNRCVNPTTAHVIVQIVDATLDSILKISQIITASEINTTFVSAAGNAVEIMFFKKLPRISCSLGI